jgi:hypothetical protein
MLSQLTRGHERLLLRVPVLGTCPPETNLFQALHVFGLDDVGTKVSAQRALDLLGEPSYRIETSPGSEQWGYRLAPPMTDCARADRMQTRLVDVLIGQVRAPDPGQKGVTRYMRLPVGRNLKASLGLGAAGVCLPRHRRHRQIGARRRHRGLGGRRLDEAGGATSVIILDSSLELPPTTGHGTAGHGDTSRGRGHPARI